LGTIYGSRGEYEKAIDLYHRSMSIKNETGDQHGYAIAIGNLGGIYESWGKLPEALKYYEEARKIFEEVGDRRFVSTCDLMLADHWRLLGDHARSLECGQKSLELFTAIGDKHGVGMAHDCLGEIYTDHGELDKAETHLAEAEKILIKAGQASTLMTLFRAIAQLKIAMAEKDRSRPEPLAADAKKYIDRALDQATKAKALFQEANCYHMYGKLFSLTGDAEQAVENFKKAMSIFEKLRDKKILPEIYFDYAKMLKSSAAAERRKEADEYFGKAL
jgi:tetratricopeptide (TPR) repeat protein